jgi:hypothetical protein
LDGISYQFIFNEAQNPVKKHSLWSRRADERAEAQKFVLVHSENPAI